MTRCKKCVLPGNYPGIEFDENSICNLCTNSAKNENEITKPGHQFENEMELIKCIEKRKNANGKYDVLVPLSGGVDSCYSLITIVEKYKLRALGFHNDHGYEDETATRNVRELCARLKVDLVILQQDFEFMKKLWKYLNEADVQELNTCYICGNILFLNALEAADRFNIPMVINGYSKGQAAMTYDKEWGSFLLEKLIDVLQETGDKEFFNEFMGKYKILEKKVDYQIKEDLETVDPQKILFIPFYVFEFYITDKQSLKEEIKKRFDWQPMKFSYPNRTTNCEMVWLNTYMDREKMGYSLYEIEYSELVRRGELTREQALEDLEFSPPEGLVERLAEEVGVDINKFREKKKPVENETKNNRLKIDFEF